MNIDDIMGYFEILGYIDEEQFCDDFARAYLRTPSWLIYITENESQRLEWFKNNLFCGSLPVENRNGTYQYFDAYYTQIVIDLDVPPEEIPQAIQDAYESAVIEYQKVIDNFPESLTVPDAYLGKAACLSDLVVFGASDYESVLDILDYVKTEYAGIDRIMAMVAWNSLASISYDYPTYYDSYAQYEIGMTYRDMGDDTRAISELQKVIDDYPETNDALEALYQQGRIYRYQDQCLLAIPLYEKAIDDYFETYQTNSIYYDFDNIFFDLGYCYNETGDCEKAVSTFEKGSDTFIDSYPQAQEIIDACL